MQLDNIWLTKDTDLIAGTSFNITPNGVISIRAAGEDIWLSNDEFGAVYRPVTGDFTAIVKITQFGNTSEWSKAGLFVRNNVQAPGASAGYLGIFITPSHGIAYQYDSNANGFLDSDSSGTAYTLPLWFKIQKVGTTFTSSTSQDGVTFTTRGTTVMASANSQQHVGVILTSHATGIFNTATFSDFQLIAGTGKQNQVKAYITKPPFEKQYQYRVYDQGVFKTVWSKEVVSTPRFRSVINGGPGELVVRLIRDFDNFGEDDDVKLFNDVELVCFDKDAPNGTLIYSGFISGYRPVLDGHKEYMEVTLLHNVAEMSSFILRTTSGTTNIPQLSLDPSTIYRNIIDFYKADGGAISYTPTSIDTTGTTVSYTFSTYTVKEALDKAIELTPEQWFWRVDPDNNLYLKRSNLATADHAFIIGKHFSQMETWRRGEDMVNRVYFVGGDLGGGNNLYRVYSNAGSITTYGIHAVKYVDGRVTLNSTADTIANRVLNTKKDPEIRTTMTIMDNNGLNPNRGYDIESVKPGQTMKIKGLKQGVKTISYWDQMEWDVDVWDQTLASSAADIIQIMSVEYTPNYILIEASSRLPEISKRVEDVNRNLEATQTVDTPGAPTVA